MLSIVVHYLVDPVEKRVVAQIRGNETVALPNQRKEKGGFKGLAWLKDENGDYIRDDITKEYDKENNGYIPIYEYDEKTGDIETDIITFNDFKKREEDRLKKDGVKLNGTQREGIIRKFHELQQMKNINYFLGQSKEFETYYYKGLKERETIIDNYIKASEVYS